MPLLTTVKAIHLFSKPFCARARANNPKALLMGTLTLPLLHLSREGSILFFILHRSTNRGAHNPSLYALSQIGRRRSEALTAGDGDGRRRWSPATTANCVISSGLQCLRFTASHFLIFVVDEPFVDRRCGRPSRTGKCGIVLPFQP